jgi:hypothetical protein
MRLDERGRITHLDILTADPPFGRKNRGAVVRVHDPCRWQHDRQAGSVPYP